MKKKSLKFYKSFDDDYEDEERPIKKSHKDYERDKKNKDVERRKSRELKSSRWE